MEELREYINRTIIPKKYPNPSVFIEIYTEHNICPICTKKTTEIDMIHPNDINKKLRIHKECWDMIRASWVCRSCRKYFSNVEESIRMVEMGAMCKGCYQKYREKILKEG